MEPVYILDGSPEVRDRVMKRFFGLREDQTYQDIVIDDDYDFDDDAFGDDDTAE